VLWLASYEICSTLQLQDGGDVFYPMRVTRSYDIQPLFDVQVFAQPSHSSELLYSVSLRVVDTGDVDDLRISQVTSVSPSWKAAPVAASNVSVRPPGVLE
jgi:hypothetical protein